MMRSWGYWGLLLMAAPAVDASADEVGGNPRTVIQAHDPGAHVGAPRQWNAKGGSCSDADVAKHYALGHRLGIPGTPMIVMGDGTSLGGYMPPDKLLAALEEHARERSQGAGGNFHEQWLAVGKLPTDDSL